MGDRLLAGKPEPPGPTQPPSLSGTGNENRSKCGNALRLGIKAGWLFPLWMNMYVAGETV